MVSKSLVGRRWHKRHATTTPSSGRSGYPTLPSISVCLGPWLRLEGYLSHSDSFYRKRFWPAFDIVLFVSQLFRPLLTLNFELTEFEFGCYLGLPRPTISGQSFNLAEAQILAQYGNSKTRATLLRHFNQMFAFHVLPFTSLLCCCFK